MFSADDAAEVLGIGATTVRLVMTSGRLKYVRVGRGRKISAQEIDRFISMSETFAADKR
ncbi:excisionase family DNA-binding protein [Rhodococcus hoagii]|nr:excisionase family DNA-binding protein [Prescottella equi]NKS59888.1 excisionase family DNA-binding protein [Prescottella equi]